MEIKNIKILKKTNKQKKNVHTSMGPYTLDSVKRATLSSSASGFRKDKEVCGLETAFNTHTGR